MSRFPLHRALTVGAVALSVAIAGGCQPSPPAAVVTSSTAAPVAPPGEPALGTAGLTGSADIGGVPLAGADVKIFRPGQTAPIAIGKTGPDGRFSIALGNVIAAGGGNVIAPGGGNVIAPGGGNVIAPGGGNVIAPGGGNVIAPGGGNVIAAGGGNVIAPGGGNVIAPGGGNLLALGAPLKVVASKDGAALAGIATAGVIAAGGGNVIAAGGGNVIAAGGGNVIAAGGGNYRVLATSDVHLDAATTLAVIALGDRLDAAMRAVQSNDGHVVTTALEAVLSAYTRLADTVASSLTGEGGSHLVEAVTRALDANGDGSLSASAQSQVVGAIADFSSAFTQSASELGVAIQTAASSGGTPTGGSDGVSFGGVSAPAVGSGSTSSGTTTTTSGTSGSSGASGGSGGTTQPMPFTVSVNGQLAPADALVTSPLPVRPTGKSFSAFNTAASTVGGVAYTFTQRFGVGLVSYGGAFYELGGNAGAGPTDLVSQFPLVPLTLNGSAVTTLGTRSEPQTLAAPVYDHGTAVTAGNVYVVGGRDATGPVATVQALALSGLGTSSPFAMLGQTLGTARFQLSVSAASDASASRLYAVGGQGVGGTVLASVERKDVLPTSTGWSNAGATLLTARQAHVSVVTITGAGTPAFLYVIGGRTGTTTLDSIERAPINGDGSLGAFTQPNVSFTEPKTGVTMTYPIALTDPTHNETGTPANNESHGRFGMQAAVIGNWLYVFGGLRDVGGGQVRPVPWADRAPIDPATGVVGAFTPSPATMLGGRGFYALGLCFNLPGDPTTPSDAILFGGAASDTGGVNVTAERSLWR